MKTFPIGILVASALLQGCSTYMTPDGRVASGVSPAAAGLLEAALGGGLGVATGALMGNSPGWATGGVSGTVSSVGTQLVSALTQGAQGQGAPYRGNQGYYQGPQPSPYYRARGGSPQPQYPQYPQSGQYQQQNQYQQVPSYGDYY